jgi:hypothetical protein
MDGGVDVRLFGCIKSVGTGLEVSNSALAFVDFICISILSFEVNFISKHTPHPSQDMFLPYAFSLLALPLSSLANPILSKRSISDANFTTISYYGEYAAAAYCRGNLVNVQQTKISCSENNANNCGDVSSADHTIIDRFAK